MMRRSSTTLTWPAERPRRDLMATDWKKAGEQWRLTLPPSSFTVTVTLGVSREASATRFSQSLSRFRTWGACRTENPMVGAACSTMAMVEGARA